MEYHKPIIGNFFLNHPILSGIKLILVFVWIPAFNDMSWNTYLHFYLPFIGVTTENGKNSTLSDLVFVKVIDN